MVLSTTTTTPQVTYGVVLDFYRRSPPHKFRHWQQLLQSPITEYLRALMDDNVPRWGPLHWTDKERQYYFLYSLQEDYAVSCEFPAPDLLRVWAHVCGSEEPYDAVMPCGVCGYVFPDSKVIFDPALWRLRELTVRHDPAFAWTCEYCVADGGLCQAACGLSFVSKWNSNELGADQDQHWLVKARKQKKWWSECSEGMHRSVAALYVRRGIARALGSVAGATTLNSAPFHKYADKGDKHLVHDQLFYRLGYDVPFPVAVPEEAYNSSHVSYWDWLNECRASALGTHGRPGHSPRTKGIIETALREARESTEEQPMKRRKVAREQRIEECRSEALAILQAVQQAGNVWSQALLSRRRAHAEATRAWLSEADAASILDMLYQ